MFIHSSSSFQKLTNTEINNLNCELFVIRGNHDMPPNEISGIKKVFNKV